MPKTMKAITPKNPLDVASIRLSILNELRHQNVLTKYELDKGVSTWDEKPKFETEISLTGKDATAKVFTTSDIYRYIDKGTKIRWALMSGDWVSKTVPGSLLAGSGKGEAVLVGRKAFERLGIPPRPGIKARNFTKKIAKNRKPEFVAAMKSAVQNGVKKSWGT